MDNEELKMDNYQLSIVRYPLYKDSGVDLIEHIPSHWSISRIKEKGLVYGRVGWKALKASEYVEEGYIFLSTPNIKGRKIDFDNVNYITHERYVESPEIMLKEDDILLAKDGSTLGTVNIISSLPNKATVNSSIAVLRFDKSIFNKYMFYQITSQYIQAKIKLKKIGMGVPHLFQRDIKNFIILIPSLPDQHAIAAYLDTKTAQIDRKIDLLTQKAEKYGQLKQSLINETVTGKRKVIDNGELTMDNYQLSIIRYPLSIVRYPLYKDSGVEWLGEVPAHWEIRRIKDELSSFDHKRIPLSGDVRENMINPRFDYYGASGVIDKVDDYIFDEPLILIGEDGANLLMRNSPLAFIAKGKYWVNNHAHILKPRKGKLEFFCYLLESFDYTTLVSGSAQPKLTASELNNVFLMVPPLPEQRAIADYLDAQTAHIDRIIKTIHTEIEKLKELRKTLINDVVTGKIKIMDNGQWIMDNG